VLAQPSRSPRDWSDLGGSRLALVGGRSGRLTGVSFDPYQPYGPVVETTMRVVTWNVWGRYGAWEQRQAGIEGHYGVLADLRY